MFEIDPFFIIKAIGYKLRLEKYLHEVNSPKSGSHVQHKHKHKNIRKRN